MNQGGAAAPEQTKPRVIKPQSTESVQQPQQAVQAQPAAPKPAVEPAPVQQAVQPQVEPKSQPPETEKVAEPALVEPPKARVKVTENQKPQIEKVDAVRESVAVAGGKTPGWTCKSADGKQNWNCNLVGPDPKGEAQVVADAQIESHWLTPAFTHAQERSFQTLRGEFGQDPWQSCERWSTKKRKNKSVSNEARETATTEVNADASEIFEGDVLNFAGNVDLTRADQHLMADKASYDTVAQTMDAQGNVIYSESQMAMAGDTVSLSMAKDEARLRNALFIVGEGPFRGSADTIYRDSKSLSRYNNPAFTSCAPGNQDWVMHASRLKINREVGQGSAKHAWLEFKGVPVLYTPYISFPTDNRRLSGILAPTWGNTQRNGFDVTLPYYWNIAPNYDMIITPRYMSKRGGMLRDRFRYLTEISSGTLSGEILPYDQLKDKSRYSVSFRDISKFTERLNSTTNINYVSDKEYFNDLNNALGFQTDRFLSSTGYLNYARPDVAFTTGLIHYQSVDKTITDFDMPYDVLPRVGLNLHHDFDGMPVEVAMNSQYSHFFHRDRVNGQRINLAPSISLPLESSAGFFIPRITGQYTQYQLSNQTIAGEPDSVSRALPIFSVDSGLTFERSLDFGGSPYTNTLEPRVFYLYIPRKDQSNIPVFDSSLYDTNFFSLFRENRFSGWDRIQDANQITLAGTSRFIDSTTGLEPLRVSLGQIVYFQDRTVNLTDKNNPNSVVYPVENSNTSNFIGELSGQMTKNLSYSTGAQWDPEANGLARGQAMLKFRNQPDEIFDIGYRYRRATATGISTLPQTTISQTDVSFRWPLAAGWYGLGRWQYSLNFDKTTESFIGLEKENCCWRIRFIGRRYINGASTTNIFDPNAKPENAFFVQLELKGLSSFGNDVDSFLQTNLNGYRKAGYFD